MPAASGRAPASRGRLVQQALPGMSRLCDTPERTAGIFLRTASEVFARWFLSLRGAMSREKARQQAYREENGFKRKAKVPSQSLELTPAESAVASASEGVIRAMFGDSPADYAKFKFDCAVRKADMRSFKIRLLMIKARDSLTGDIHEEFHKWAPVYIEEAERVAGCIPCPGPRRLSKAEQERKRRREEAKNAYCELPFEEGVTIGECNSDNNEESVKKERPGRTSRSVKEALLEPISDGYPCVSKIISSMSKVLGENTIENLANQIKVEDIQHDFSDSSPADSVTVTPDQHDSGSDVTLETCVTVTHHSDESVDAGHAKSTHKAREYSSASEILEDIKSGTIAPYKSATDIVDDMKRGVLSPPEAMLFITVLDKCSDQSGKKTRRSKSKREEEVDNSYEEEIENEEEAFEELEEGEKELSFSPEGFGSEWEGEEEE